MTTVQDNRSKWVAALRSGTYAQTRRALRTSEGWCCLGVACDVLGDGQWEQPTPNRRDVFPLEWQYRSGGRAYGMHLPPAVRNLVGLDGDTQRKLITANDRGVTFTDIADLIDGLE